MTIEANLIHTNEAIKELLKGIVEYLDKTKGTQRFILNFKLEAEDC